MSISKKTRSFVNRLKAQISKREQYQKFDGKIEKSLKELKDRKKLTKNKSKKLKISM